MREMFDVLPYKYGDLAQNIIIIYSINFMQSNIHMHPQTLITRPIFDLSSQSIIGSEEAQIRPILAEETHPKLSKRMTNYDILSPSAIESYALNPQLLSGCQIQEFQRAKIRLWIAENCHSRRITSRTSSLACYILDLYFSKGNSCSIEELHEYGICCLRIANKLQDNFIIPVNVEAFDTKKLVEIEAKICIKVNFELNPLTFTDIARCLNNLWTDFRTKIQQNGLNNDCGVQSDLKLEDKAKVVSLDYSFILFHELLELLHLILESFSYRLDTLVFNSFYLVLCLQFHDHRKVLSSSQIYSFTRKSESMRKILQCFTKFCRESNYLLNLEVKEDCQSFIYPIYNLLVSESKNSKVAKENDFTFNPNDPSLRVDRNDHYQTLRFKNKNGSFRKYSKRQAHQKFRKCSEATHL